MKKILCPIDFSEASLNALSYAQVIAEKYQTSLTLLNIFTDNEFDELLQSDDVDHEISKKTEIAEQKLKQLADTINKNSKSKGLTYCDFQLRFGKLIPSVSDHIKEHKNQLIVMGTSGFGGQKEGKMGSNTATMIEKVSANVLCIPYGKSYEDFSDIIYGSDYYEEDKIAIRNLVSFATLFKSNIKILHITASQENEAKNDLDQFRKSIETFISYPQMTYSICESNDELKGLQEYAKKNNVDLIVLLKINMSFLYNLFHDSLTKKMTYFSDFPLLVLKNID